MAYRLFNEHMTFSRASNKILLDRPAKFSIKESIR